MASLADVVVVVEAAANSTALTTAEAALALGKTVMAVPGSVFSPLSVGCRQLLCDGAGLVQNAADILAALPSGRPSPATLNADDIRARSSGPTPFARTRAGECSANSRNPNPPSRAPSMAAPQPRRITTGTAESTPARTSSASCAPPHRR